MSYISERKHEKKLNEKGINIRTFYSDGNKLYQKNTDNSLNENLAKGVRVEKDYYVNNKLLKKTFGFDPRIEYTFINSAQIGEDFDCPNCRMITKVSESIESCPFCGSHFNLDYKNKDMGSKYHYDRILHSKKYILVTFIIDMVASFLLSYLYFIKTSRTYNIYDIMKTVGLGLAVALILFFVFYLIDGLVVLLPIKIKKDKINNNDKKVWKDLDEKKISYNTFYNNLNYELGKYYFDNTSSIIDYDIIDYYDFKLAEDASNLYLSFTMLLREVTYENNKLTVKTKERNVVVKKNNKPVTIIDDGEVHTINCHNCGASIDITSDKCNYCDTPNNYNQEWYLYKIS